ncbi:MAG TPA: nickel-dependent lactate racemase [Fimbriimonas sp.]|nr:nickel-dependent lactate racemase [Fimbriimonas sp.]
MKVTLDFGKQPLSVELPDANVVAVLGLQPMTPLSNPAQAVLEAIRSPIGCLPLREIALGKKNACIVICDITRPVPNRHILPAMLDELQAAGLESQYVTVLIATGTHRPNVGDELDLLVGQEILTRCRVENHYCREEHRYLGISPNGVPIYLNATYLDADLKITVGMIEPHFMAGYAGGRKMVMPGVAGLATVQAWHSPKFLEPPSATNGIVKGNPTHEEALWIARLAKPDMIVDVALDSSKRACRFFAGEMELAWEAGVRFVEPNVLSTVPEPVDIVVTSGGGFPLDLTFYQAVKGMVGALPILKPNGSVIIAAACAEGIGNKHFADTLLSTTDIDGFPVAIEHPDWTFVPDQWQVEELAKAVRGRRVFHINQGIPPDVLSKLFVTPCDTVEEAVRQALEIHGNDAKIAVIPKGPYVLPQIGRS